MTILKLLATITLMVAGPNMCRYISEQKGADKIPGILFQVLLMAAYACLIIFL